MLPSVFGYLPEYSDSFAKLAEAKQPSRAKEVAKIVGTNLAGLGLGTLAGYGASKGLDYLATKRTGAPLPIAYRYAIPAVTGGLGLAHSLWTEHERKRLSDIQSKRDKTE